MRHYSCNKTLISNIDIENDWNCNFVQHKCNIISNVVWIVIGTALIFILFAVTGRGQSLFGTMICSFFSGFVGIIVSSLSLRKFSGYKLFLALILAAYFLRVVTGVIIYQCSYDGDYFKKQGMYVNSEDHKKEYLWTYLNVLIAADRVAKGEWRTTKIFTKEIENKNPYLHTWMGYFMASGNSKHALDLAPFNAYHHAISGILITGLALASCYPANVALFSGILTAWIPWGFPSSIMWRDSVGFAGILLSVCFLSIGRHYGSYMYLLMAIPACFFSWINRTPYLFAIYFIVIFTILSIKKNNNESNFFKLTNFLLLTIFVFAVNIYFFQDIALLSFERYSGKFSDYTLRILTFPLLVLRALAGPFPWFVGSSFNFYVFFDYIYHVLQLSIFLILIVNFKRIIQRANILFYTGVIFWLIGVYAIGVHTAYLAVGFPFVLPAILSTDSNLFKYFFISAMCFIFFNAGYILLNLTGSGLIMNITGY